MPAAPYWHAGVLHVAQTTLKTPHRSLVTAGGTTLVGHPWLDDIARWWLVDETRLIPMVAGQDVIVTPVISPDGRLVAWEEVKPESTTITAWDVAAQQVIATHRVTIKQGCCDGPSVRLFGADSQGQVYFGAGHDLNMWNPASEVVHVVTGLNGLPNQPNTIAASGPVFQGVDEGSLMAPGVFGPVDASGVFHRVGTVPSDQDGSWAPDGTMFAYPSDDAGDYTGKDPSNTIAVLNVQTHERHVMRLPSGGARQVLWESPRTILVHTGTDGGEQRIVRCRTDTDACETALLIDKPGTWSFPERS